VHDRYFLSNFAEVVWEIRDGKIKVSYPSVI
jgi:ATPase subunit of ABC transporter with duplicated ATPase domains